MKPDIKPDGFNWRKAEGESWSISEMDGLKSAIAARERAFMKFFKILAVWNLIVTILLCLYMVKYGW